MRKQTRKLTKREIRAKRLRSLAYARWCVAQRKFWKNFIPNTLRGIGRLTIATIVLTYRITVASLKAFFVGPIFGIPIVPPAMQKKMKTVSFLNKYPKSGGWRVSFAIISWWLQTRFALVFLGFVIYITVFGGNFRTELLSPVPDTSISITALDTVDAATEPSATPTPSSTPSATVEPKTVTKEIDWSNPEEAYILTNRYSDIIYKQWILESSKGKNGVAATCRNGKNVNGKITKGYNDFGYMIKQDGDLFCFPTFEASVDAMVAWWDKNWKDQTLEIMLCTYNKGGQSSWVTKPETCPNLKYVQDFHSLPTVAVESAK